MLLLDFSTEILDYIVVHILHFPSVEDCVHTLSSLSCTCHIFHNVVSGHRGKMISRVKDETQITVGTIREACALYSEPRNTWAVPNCKIVGTSGKAFNIAFSTFISDNFSRDFHICEKTGEVCRKSYDKHDIVYWAQINKVDQYLSTWPNQPNHYSMYVADNDDLLTFTGEGGKHLYFDISGTNITPFEFIKWIETRYGNVALEVVQNHGLFRNYGRIFCKKIKPITQVDGPVRNLAMKLGKRLKKLSEDDSDKTKNILHQIELILQ